VPESLPPFSGILETVLYCEADEREQVERFYSDLLGLQAVARWEDGTSYRVGSGVLLIFDLERLGQREDPISAHGSAGPGHACLLAGGGDYERWKERLEVDGVEIAHEHEWSEGMRSFYFRDPAGNLIEIASGDLWPSGQPGP
jgi:catechol 2,3-dioxygenase-like lactoylglutathione lyase family enzyme